MYHLGAIGAGEIFLQYEKAINNMKNISLVAIADTNETVLKKRIKPGRELFNNPEKLLNKKLDGVMILTPNACHVPLVLKALSLNQNVLCEKPLAINLNEAKDAIQYANKKNAFLYVAMHCRHRPEVQYARQHLKGKIVYFKQVYHENWLGAQSWYFDPKISGGGVLLDVGVNQIDWIFPIVEKLKPDKVTTHSYRHHVEIEATIEWKFSTGFGKTDLSWGAQNEKKHTIIQTDTDEIIELDHQTHTVCINGKQLFQKKCFEYEGVLRDFCTEIEKGQTESAEENFQILSLIKQAYDMTPLVFF